jgi:starch synthase (maltosyl-transferring)
VNRIRRQNPALQKQRDFCRHPCDNPQLLCYSRAALDEHNVILVVVNLDAHHRHSGFIQLDLERLGLLPTATFQVHDLLSDARYVWHGTRAYVELDPQVTPAHVFRIRPKLRSETDFDYFG